MTSQEAAGILQRFSIALELLEPDSFRARAFANAARLLEMESGSIEEMLARLHNGPVRGIGKGVESSLRELSTTGDLAALHETERQIPDGVFELLRVQGLGVKKARVLWKDASITSLDELETALRGGMLPPLPGIGAKTASKFLESIEFLRGTQGRFHRHTASREMSALQNSIEAISGVREVHVGGSLRRGCETVGDLDVIVVADEDVRESVRNELRTLHDVKWTRTSNEIWQGHTNENMPVELSVIPPASLCSRLLAVTGSKAHYEALSQVARDRGFTLKPDWAIDASGERLELSSEDEIYRALGLEPVPPPLRETASTVVKAGSRIFRWAVQMAEMRGILHVHSTYSDGLNTIRELAEVMIGAGYEYLGIADHSQSAQYAGGLYPNRVREQWQEIDALNRELTPFRIFKGTEVDILPGGKLDYDDELLAGFDYVVASIHSNFQMTEEEATERLCRALANPHVDILGHMTGRLLMQRPGYPVNHERVIQCAADHGKAIELNSHPYRLDIDWRWLSLCQEKGVPVPISPDAHALAELEYVRYGVEVAAKGPLTADGCLNTWSAEDLQNWFQTRKRPS